MRERTHSCESLLCAGSLTVGPLPSHKGTGHGCPHLTGEEEAEQGPGPTVVSVRARSVLGLLLSDRGSDLL